MIESHHSVNPVVTDPVPRRRPQPTELPTAVGEEPSRAGSVRRVSDPALMQVLAERHGAAQEGVRNQPHQGLGLRVSQALSAYSATERMAEREYVARFMGIDDWV